MRENKKYKLELDKACNYVTPRYRIIALRDIGDDVKEGDVGGHVHGEWNLSPNDNCWIYPGASCLRRGLVTQNAKIRGESKVTDYAIASGDSEMKYGSELRDHATLRGRAIMEDFSVGKDYALIEDYAIMKEKSIAKGTVKLKHFAKTGEYQEVWYGTVAKDLTNPVNLKYSILHQTGIAVMETGDFYAYKKVRNRIYPEINAFESIYDSSFLYHIGRIVRVKNPNVNKVKSCTSGLHVSHPLYWDGGKALLLVKCNIKDVLAVQMGKIRVKRLKVMGVTENFDVKGEN